MPRHPSDPRTSSADDAGRPAGEGEGAEVICLTRERYRRRQVYDLLPHEDPVAVRLALEALLGRHAPRNPAERFAVERIHKAQLRVQRYGHFLARLESLPAGTPIGGHRLSENARAKQIRTWSKLLHQGEQAVLDAIRFLETTREATDTL